MAFSSFFAGLSGLQAHSNMLNVIGNDLANTNTIGYKGSRLTFNDVFSQTAVGAGVNGAGNPMQVGLGVQTSGIDQLFAQGSLQTTGVVTDVAIQGAGFFVLEDQDGTLFYTRGGNFSFDKDGNLVTNGGQLVQGYTQADVDGNILSSGALTSINIPAGLNAPPQATDSFTTVLNLNARATLDDPATARNEAEVFSTTLAIYDSLGGRHNITLTFTPVDTDADGSLDQWDYEVTVDGGEVSGGVPDTPFVLDSGTMQFDDTGELTSPSGDVTINTPTWSNGAAAQTIDWNLFDDAAEGTISGFDDASATYSVNQNGFGVGRLRTLIIDQDGLIAGIFTNGETLQLARFALATFNNQNGLLKNGQNNFLGTQASGEATIGAPNSGGRGIVSANALELSNVDITQEFTEMIIAQRGYQANSRIITTTDQVMQEALNLKR
jgi:flagellar hook protein FlgE